MQTEPRKSNGSVSGITNSLDSANILKRQLGAELHSQPFAILIVISHSLVALKLNEDIGHDITDTEYVKSCHCPPCPYSTYPTYALLCHGAAKKTITNCRLAGFAS